MTRGAQSGAATATLEGGRSRLVFAGAPRVDLRSISLPPRDRTDAAVSVCDVTKWFGETSGGVKTYLTEKIRYVTDRPHLRHVLMIPGPHDAIALGSGVRTYRLRGPRVPTQTAYRFLLATRSTRRIVLHERPSIMEVGSPYFVPWVAAHAVRGLHVPLVCFHHSSFAGVLQAMGWAQGRGNRPARAAVGAYARLLDRLFRVTIVASDFAMRELRDLGVDRIERVPLGVNLVQFHPRRRASREATLRRFGVPLDRPVAVYAGRLAREKRLDVVLDAWPQVQRDLGVHLVIAGAGAEERQLRARCAARHVTWLPYQHDREMIARLQAAADLTLAPGEVETFGLAALEAMAAGTPVVGVRSGAVAEHVDRSGAGSLYEPGEPADVVRAVRDVLHADFRSLSLRARSYAEREHDWTRVFDQLFALYRRILVA